MKEIARADRDIVVGTEAVVKVCVEDPDSATRAESDAGSSGGIAETGFAVPPDDEE